MKMKGRMTASEQIVEEREWQYTGRNVVWCWKEDGDNAEATKGSRKREPRHFGVVRGGEEKKRDTEKGT